VGGAHTDPDKAAALVDGVLARVLEEISAVDSSTRLDRRYDKFRGMGRVGVDFVEEG
jgi:acetyl-CoA carboxylase alpha subunit